MPFPVADEFIDETERKLGIVFPQSFRKRMRRNNGGELLTTEDAWELFPFHDATDRKHISRTCNDIVRETNNARQWPEFPPEAVAIGSNGGGDVLILLPSVADSTLLQPNPFVWLHETGELDRTDISFDGME